MKVALGGLQGRVDSRLREMEASGLVSRLLQHDHTLWSESPHEITNRLGWLDLPRKMPGRVDSMESLARELVSQGYTRALLLGMGGSSLAPEVLRESLGVKAPYLDLSVIDSTDPDFIASIAEGLDLQRTLFIVSTKSGTTVETLSLFRYFYTLTRKALGIRSAGEHFIAVTDPGSPLEGIGRGLGFREVFLADPDLGGRYSALSHFGLVPASLMGADIRGLLQSAQAMARACETPCLGAGDGNPACLLGAVLGEAALAGRDKATFVLSLSIRSFGDWVEQLIAESTGKQGRGIVPVVRELPGRPGSYRDDRLFIHLYLKGEEADAGLVDGLEAAGRPVVRIGLKSILDLGAQFFLWEAAVAVAGHVLGINPFDQPDVEAAKGRAREAVDAFGKTGSLPGESPVLEDEGIAVYGKLKASSLEEALERFLAPAPEASYAAIQAYLPPSEGVSRALDALSLKVRDACGLAVTWGYGPRYLHSTGQLHKGDAGRGLFIQLTCENSRDLPIPDEPGSESSSITFGTLKSAQALGDRNALREKGRKVLCLHLSGRDIPQALERISGAL
ncbi:MAG: glucose-6-phosphate isomerase [Desulfomonilia bacterium]